MSNLYKQYFVTNASGGMRVINSDERLRQQLLDKNAEAQVSQEQRPPDASSGEFTEGIKPPEIDVEAIRKDALDAAQKEAEKITSDAQAQAQQFLQDAQAQAQMVLAENRQLGYEQGLQEAQEQLQQRSDALEEDMRTQKQQLADNYEKKLTGMESDIVDAIINVFDKVFQIQFEDKRDILLALVKNTLLDVDAGDKIQIHISEKDFPLFQEHMSEIQDEIGPDVNLEFVHDSKLSEGQCQIETPFGVFDCGVDTELSGLLKDIRSLA